MRHQSRRVSVVPDEWVATFVPPAARTRKTNGKKKSIMRACVLMHSRSCWNLSPTGWQRGGGEARWMGYQAIAGHDLTHTIAQFRHANQPTVHIFELGEETGESRGNSRSTGRSCKLHVHKMEAGINTHKLYLLLDNYRTYKYKTIFALHLLFICLFLFVSPNFTWHHISPALSSILWLNLHLASQFISSHLQINVVRIQVRTACLVPFLY